ncbi:MAG TPA: hypothetical protein VMM35_00155 [Longimicrobiales bacterium]|nr:hypothetical protein [Longimicrobiales bacterium]
MSATSRGYLTMAVGKSHYLEMAVDMALSLRAHTSHPISLAADQALAAEAETRYPSVFDSVVLLERRFLAGRALKYGTAAATPYEETIFVDADCIVLASLDCLWGVLESTDMAMVGVQLGIDQDQNHHGFSTRDLMQRFGLERYLKTNSGLFCFRRESTLAVMEECLECYLHEARPQLRWSILTGAWLGDEIAFGIVGGRRGIDTLADPSPMYWPAEFADLDLTRPSKPLLHLIWPPPAPTLELMLRGTRERRRAADVPGDGRAHWLEEVRRLERMADRRRLWERVRRLPGQPR